MPFQNGFIIYSCYRNDSGIDNQLFVYEPKQFGVEMF